MRSKAIGCALSAALAAAAPAAALADTGTGSSTADTPVYLDVERAVLRVAVPMDLRLVAPAAGGAPLSAAMEPLMRAFAPQPDVLQPAQYAPTPAAALDLLGASYREDTPDRKSVV